MNWKKEAENELLEYKKAHNILKRNTELIKKIDIDMTNVRAAKTDMSSTKGGSGSIEEWIANCINKKEELKMQSVIAEKRIELVMRGLRELTSQERRIMELFYIERPDGFLKMLCIELGFEQSSLYYHKDIALRKFTLAVYGIIDT